MRHSNRKHFLILWHLCT